VKVLLPATLQVRAGIQVDFAVQSDLLKLRRRLADRRDRYLAVRCWQFVGQNEAAESFPIQE
jgi:hypothetical protein